MPISRLHLSRILYSIKYYWLMLPLSNIFTDFHDLLLFESSIYQLCKMAPHSNTLSWKIPRTEEPGRLQSMRSLRVRHDWATLHFRFSLSCTEEGNGNPLQCSCLENPRDGWAWWAAVYGVAKSQTQLNDLA